MKKALLILVALAFAISCTTRDHSAKPDATTSPPAAPAPGIPDSEIGLAAGTAFEQPEQAPIAFNPIDPGESEPRPRPNAEFPPAIPHSIADLETITLGENSCLDCHDPEAAPDMGAVALPPSHQVDLRRAPDVIGVGTVGSRWVCTSCHVSLTDTAPLVGNSSSG